eukprot:NODE_6459_length_509_cov_40.567391_g5681_i0.p1 GENE.NODE_6459_length_509_cov_40.567391_g5681_i0~~NODE_6459_length_509_cov_40.567391_g5681_i0.p1  ORF type:complete len:89 (-),score=22.86 NODE_6459_length_509_cov_40.567391_g5681_i0:103-369(-)
MGLLSPWNCTKVYMKKSTGTTGNRYAFANFASKVDADIAIYSLSDLVPYPGAPSNMLLKFADSTKYAGEEPAGPPKLMPPPPRGKSAK